MLLDNIYPLQNTEITSIGYILCSLCSLFLCYPLFLSLLNGLICFITLSPWPVNVYRTVPLPLRSLEVHLYISYTCLSIFFLLQSSVTI